MEDGTAHLVCKTPKCHCAVNAKTSYRMKETVKGKKSMYKPADEYFESIDGQEPRIYDQSFWDQDNIFHDCNKSTNRAHCKKYKQNNPDQACNKIKHTHALTNTSPTNERQRRDISAQLAKEAKKQTAITKTASTLVADTLRQSNLNASQALEIGLNVKRLENKVTKARTRATKNEPLPGPSDPERNPHYETQPFDVDPVRDESGNDTGDIVTGNVYVPNFGTVFRGQHRRFDQDGNMIDSDKEN